MRGYPIHNAIVAQLARHARDLGCTTQTECSVGAGAVDLLISRPGLRVVVEVEFRPARALTDVHKALAAGVSHLFIVTPDAGVSRAIRSRLRRVCPPTPGLLIHVLHLGRALAELKGVCSD